MPRRIILKSTRINVTGGGLVEINLFQTISKTNIVKNVDQFISPNHF